MLTGLLVAAVLVALFLLVPWFAQRMQDLASDSSGGSGVFNVLEEVFHPSAHRAQLVQEQQKEKRASLPDGEPPDGEPSEGEPADDGPPVDDHAVDLPAPTTDEPEPDSPQALR